MQDQTVTPTVQPNAMSRFPDAPPTPLIKHLPEPYRPNPSTSCETCPSAIFFQTLDGSTKCHCSTLNVISWHDKETNRPEIRRYAAKGGSWRTARQAARGHARPRHGEGAGKAAGPSASEGRGLAESRGNRKRRGTHSNEDRAESGRTRSRPRSAERSQSCREAEGNRKAGGEGTGKGTSKRPGRRYCKAC